MKRHYYLELIKKRFEVNPICALLGPRQVGKTTLARQFIAEQFQQNDEASKISLPELQDLRKKENKIIREEALLFIADHENKDENVIEYTKRLLFLNILFKKDLLTLPIKTIGAYQEVCFRIKRDNPELAVFIVNPEDLGDIQKNQQLQETVRNELAKRGFIKPENLPAPTDWEIVTKNLCS